MSPPRKPSLRSVLPSTGKKLLGRPGEFFDEARIVNHVNYCATVLV